MMKVAIVLSVLAICCLQQANAGLEEVSECLSDVEAAIAELDTPLGFEELYILLGVPIAQSPAERAQLDERLRKECTAFVAEGAKILSSSACGAEVPNFLRSSEGEAESKTLEQSFPKLDNFGKQMSVCIMFNYSSPPKIEGLACPRKASAPLKEERKSENHVDLDSQIAASA